MSDARQRAEEAVRTSRARTRSGREAPAGGSCSHRSPEAATICTASPVMYFKKLRTGHGRYQRADQGCRCPLRAVLLGGARGRLGAAPSVGFPIVGGSWYRCRRRLVPEEMEFAAAHPLGQGRDPSVDTWREQPERRCRPGVVLPLAPAASPVDLGQPFALSERQTREVEQNEHGEQGAADGEPGPATQLAKHGDGHAEDAPPEHNLTEKVRVP
mmetsp:Transcript_37926/g.100456  ORF Transcript_37926/g.100456 Transcript_37926/m.100456 type:complete len:214 (+) Transcript_37926:104-745(+)